MSENFLKFKRKSNLAVLIKSLLSGLCAGLFLSGITLVLSKLCLLNISPILALPIGVLGFLTAGGVGFILMRKSDLKLAKELDLSFGLSERAQTMVFLGAEDGSFAKMQREDTDSELDKIPLSRYKLKRLWAFILAASIGAAMFAAGIIVPNLRNVTPPEKVEPFALSEVQRIGLLDVIAHVENSDMEEPYRTETANQLKQLLSKLENIKTKPEMKTAVTESMAYITEITYNSSSMTEIVTALWDTEDKYAMALAYALNTGDWREPVWGDFIEKWNEYIALYEHTPAEGETAIPEEAELKSELLWKLQKTAVATVAGLENSRIPKTDSLYAALDSLINLENDTTPPIIYGLLVIANGAERKNLEAVQKEVADTFNGMSKALYDVISTQKINTNEGEYALTKVSTLFMVPLPGFERPNLAGGGESEGGSSGKDDDDDEKPSGGGGVGDGVIYGSNDLVLDPVTGEYVEYGTLLERYFPLMEAKLASGEYTEQQKQAIKNYFALLYGGIKKDEGN